MMYILVDVIARPNFIDFCISNENDGSLRAKRSNLKNRLLRRR